MNAVKLLKADHKELAAIFEKFRRADDEDEKGRLAVQVCQMLTVHAQIEQELLYPAARYALKEDHADLVNEAAVEHASIKELVRQIEAASPSHDLFDAKVKVLGEYVTHHVKEEEGELFPKLQESELDLENLGVKLEERKTELTSGADAKVDSDEQTATMSKSESQQSESRRKGNHRPSPR
jgi:hemerythrin superfamily protein